MMTAEQVTEIVTLYAKHGWKLRRVLLSADSRKLRGELLFSEAEMRDAPFDGLWFSRRSRPGTESWELRRLSGTPFALVEVIEDGSSAEEFEKRLAETETRMAETLKSGNGAV